MDYNFVALGIKHGVAINEDNTMSQWGDEEVNQRDDFDEDIKVKQVACGGDFSVAIKEDSTIIQWGDKTHNQRDNFNKDIKVKQVACGGDFSVAIKEDGRLIQWGSSSNSVMKNFPEGVKFKFVSCGVYFSAGIKEDGTLLLWGNVDDNLLQEFTPEFRQLKLKDVACGREDDFIVCIKEDNTVVKLGNIAPPPQGIKCVSVSCGERHVVCIKEDKTLIQWGDETSKQKEHFPESTKVKQISCNVAYSSAITEDDKLIIWGNLDYDNMIYFPNPMYMLQLSTPETLDPNPYPKYNSKIIVKELPSKPFTYKSDTRAFDPVMQTDVTINEAIADQDKPLIVKVGDAFSLIDRTYLKRGISDLSLIRYGCNKTLESVALAETVYGKNPFIYIKGHSAGNFMVLLSELEFVLKSGIQSIELLPSGDEFNTVSNFNSVMRDHYLDYNTRRTNIVSSDHCQEGSQKKVYSINVLKLVKEGGKRRRRTYKKKSKVKKTRRSRNAF